MTGIQHPLYFREIFLLWFAKCFFYFSVCRYEEVACSLNISDADQDCIENMEVRDLIVNTIIGIYTMHQRGQPEFQQWYHTGTVRVTLVAYLMKTLSTHVQ